MNTVLVIEDDELALYQVTQLLEYSGYAVVATADRPQGIQLFKATKPDVVVLDLGLPSMSGLDVLRQIFMIDNQARVIVVTGYPSTTMNEKARQLGAVSFLAKPLQPEILLESVRDVLEARKK